MLPGSWWSRTWLVHPSGCLPSSLGCPVPPCWCSIVDPPRVHHRLEFMSTERSENLVYFAPVGNGWENVQVALHACYCIETKVEKQICE